MLQHTFFERMHVRIIDMFQRDQPYVLARDGLIQSLSMQIHSLLYVYSGSGIIELDNVSYPLTTGCVAQLPLKRKLVIRSSEESTLCYYTIRFDYKLIEWEGTNLAFSEASDMALPFDDVVSMPDKESMLKEIHRLYTIWTDKENGYEWACKLGFLNLLQRVGEQRQLREEDITTQSILQCMDYIHNHYNEPLHRELLAQKASLSMSYFSSLFKKHTGYTPVKYITKIRLDNAKLLLRQKHKSIADVARAVGYEDPLYFAKVFTNEFGVPPREYRNM
ncbi:MAG: AraC family transcriptional regulator [Paenibacillus sp.]|nr:AraC family transcriptional regulator [Paenibacillus sp.]